MGNGTSIGQVRGLGASHSGARHWVTERLTGLASLATSTFLLVSILLLPNMSYTSVHDWIVRPVPAIVMILFVIVNFWHGKMGLMVVVEDYLHEPAPKLAAVIALNTVTWTGILFGVLCILRLALGGA